MRFVIFCLLHVLILTLLLDQFFLVMSAIGLEEI